MTTRRAIGRAALTGALLCLLPLREATAEDATVPASVQAQLISKVPGYDRGFRERAGGRVRVLVVYKRDNSESVRVMNLVASALAQQKNIAGLPHTVDTFGFSDVPTLAAESKKRSASIVYLSPGFPDQIEAICAAMRPLQIMTVTAVPDYVRRCVVLGFELEASKPKLLIHLEQAKKSGIRFSSDLLRLAKVYR